MAVAASPGTVRDGRGQGLPQKPQDSWREGVSSAHGYTDARGLLRAPWELLLPLMNSERALDRSQDSWRLLGIAPGGSCLGSAPSAALCAPLNSPPPVSSVPQPASESDRLEAGRTLFPRDFGQTASWSINPLFHPKRM